MSKDPYARSAKWYDRLIEPFVKDLRMIGLEMCPSEEGMYILDVGCGTGTHLDIYHKAGCRVFGIDSSRSMLDVAQAKVSERAGLCHGDASQMPFPDESFDLILAMFVLHEMPAPIRLLVMNEAERVMKKRGRFLVIDQHPGPTQFPGGWVDKILTHFVEFVAGREHFRNHREFMSSGGLPPLIVESGLSVDRKRIESGGTVGLYLLRGS